MTQLITKYAAKKMLRGQMEKYKSKDVGGDYDPYYTHIPHPTKKGKFKKVKKQIPDYIPEHDAVILANMRKRAYMLDMSLFNFLGIRFGWSSVVGIIPAAGDAIDALLALSLIYTCTKISCGLGIITLFRMLLNLFLDFFVGLVPFLGDLIDAAYKVNTRNVRLLEQHLDKQYKPKEVKPKKDKDGHTHPATVFEEFSDEEDGEKGQLPMYNQETGVARPQPARAPTEVRGGERPDTRGSGGRKGSSKRARQPDLEMGGRGGRR